MHKKKILVADDDLGINEALKLLLEDNGYRVSTTENGKKVLQVKEGEYDLILLDIWMPGLSGSEICKRLKSKQDTKAIPIMLISANNDTEQIAKEVGADSFIAKPFDMEELLMKVKKQVRRKNRK